VASSNILTDSPGPSPDGPPVPPSVRIAIVGSGFSGLGMAIRLKEAGIEDFVVLERANDVGGTWRDNTYPGCQCDIPSALYSFSFAPNPDWSRLYPRQAEIQDYLRRCAERFGLGPYIRFGARVEGARWDEDAGVWRIETARGALTARVLVSGVGGLSEPQAPSIRGLDRFQGTTFHSATWDHEHDLAGERVAVIGTGASAIQFVPRIQPHVGTLHLFQRTPPWVLPHMDRRFNRIERWLLRHSPPARWLTRALIYWSHEVTVFGTIKDRRLIKPIEAVARRHLRREVADPVLRRKLTPSYTIGCKRILLSNDYYRALTQPNVEVVTDGIQEVTAKGVRTSDGVEREVDTIILATGFNVHHHPSFEHVQGRDGVSLADIWAGSPRAYLGTAISGFPNHFALVGPNSAGGFNSIVFTIESHINYVLQCLRTMDEHGLRTVEVRRDVYDSFQRDVDERLSGSVWNAGGCKSWYLDAEGRNNVWWPGFTWQLWQKTRRFDLGDYVLQEERAASPAPLPVGS
jgi:cation diffusion facilitator CzcD-associated flavoprotein CzcO